MKKIFSFIIALAMTITLASAQTKTVEHSKWYENTSVTLLGGATTTGQMMDVPAPFFWDGTKAVFSLPKAWPSEFVSWHPPRKGRMRTLLVGLSDVLDHTKYRAPFL